MNDILKGYIIFCIVLISIVVIFAIAFEKPQTRIIADEQHAGTIRAALENTEKNVTRHISSVTVVNDLNMLSKMGCVNLATDVGGCAAIKYNSDTFSAEIYLASRELLTGTCLTFENVVYHEIGHVDYFYKYRNAGTYQIDQEPYAINYANQYVKDNCKR